MPFAKINAIANNARARVALVVAKYEGLELEVNTIDPTNKPTDFLAKFPQGLTPALEKDDFKLTESVAIALYLAYYENKSGLVGADKEQNALVQQWAAWANVALMAGGLGPWFRPLNGSLPYNKAGVEAAKAYTLKQLAYLEAFLADRTFLVGERVTIADIFVASVLARGFELVLDAEVRAQFPNVLRHFNTVAHQDHFAAVLGGEPTLIEKAITFTPPKKEAKPEAAKKEAPVKAAKVAEDEADEAAPAEPKAAHPVAALGNAKSWPLDEFKRQYSNNETPVAFKWLKDNWTAEAAQEYSLWRADYKYNDELTQVFMSSNLITGFHTRLEGSRKYIFGSSGVYGESNNNAICGVYLIRGNNIQDVVNVAPDSESYNFTPLDLEKDEAFVLGSWSWEHELDGKKYADGKVMK